LKKVELKHEHWNWQAQQSIQNDRSGFVESIVRTAGIGFGLIIVAGTVLGSWWYATTNSRQAGPASPQAGMTCDMGISAAKAGRAAAVPNPQPLSAVKPIVQESSASPVPVSSAFQPVRRRWTWSGFLAANSGWERTTFLTHNRGIAFMWTVFGWIRPKSPTINSRNL
jgi:hypothetical protein